MPSWLLLDASVTRSPQRLNGLKVSLWGKNLTNKTYEVTRTYVGGLFTDLYQALPRRYEIELNYKFCSASRRFSDSGSAGRQLRLIAPGFGQVVTTQQRA